MASYTHWLKHPKLTRVAWVCGTEMALMQAVARAYVSAMPAVRPVPAWGGHKELWDYLLITPPGPRLYLVHDAQEVKRLDLLPHLLGDEFDGSYAVFLADEDDFRRAGKQLIGPLAALRDSRHGQLVRCAAPASEEDAAAIVASWWPGAGKNIAAALLTQCGGSLTRAWHAVDKANRAGIGPDTRVVPSLCVRDSYDSYADLLLAGKKREAMHAARLITPDEAGGVIALLAARLALLPLVHDAVSRRESPQDTVRRLKADAWVIRQLRPHAMKYDDPRVHKCREVLAVAETAWRSGARDGVLEAIAALW